MQRIDEPLSSFPADWCTEFHIAVQEGREARVVQMIQHGADVNALDSNGLTPLFRLLHMQEYRSSFRITTAEVLLKNGALPNAKDPSTGESCIHNASLFAMHDLLEILIKNGGDVRLKAYGGTTPLHHAFSSRDPKECIKTLSLLIEAGAEIEVRDTGGVTPMEIARKHGNAEVIEYLKSHQRKP